MTQILLVGHGDFAKNLLETAQMLTGPNDRALAVQFPVGTGVEELTARVAAAVDTLSAKRDESGSAEQVLVLADVMGGSPARVALGEVLAGRAEVVTGANLPMLIEALAGAKKTAPADLARKVVASAQSGIRHFGSELRERGVSA
jgi:mannose/fructose/sorbose-specific phosphotransferase system IIA component